MSFDAVLASIRFGTGRSPVVPDPESVAAMLRRLAGPDQAAAAYPIPGMAATAPTFEAFRQARRARRAARGTGDEAATTETLRALGRKAADRRAANAIATLARQITAADGLRERLAAFWADHFTVRARSVSTRHFVTPCVEDAIRPHLSGRFADMLAAVVTHPMMLHYLDQIRSMGPGSPAGARRGLGLNENLAREVLELHTLGVRGSYGQGDVRQLAELLTGLGVDGRATFAFRPDFAEPGPETVMGRSYGGGRGGGFGAILEALGDLAVHPDTARHLSRKLAIHFVADDPPERLVAALEAAWLQSGGDLQAVTEALLSHPDAWTRDLHKVKPPQAFVASAFRALGVAPAALSALAPRDLRLILDRPLRLMGQPWEAPPGPDGWPEAAEAWITPQGMAARITWAMEAPARVLPALPDPRAFAETALGPDLPEPVRLAARAAESVPEGIGIVLSSAAFQRR